MADTRIMAEYRERPDNQQLATYTTSAVESGAANRTEEDGEAEGPAVTGDSCPVELGKAVRDICQRPRCRRGVIRGPVVVVEMTH